MHLRLKRGSEIIYLTAVGGAVVGSTYNQAASDLSAETVSESIQVILESSGADKIAELRSIELMLTRAQQRQDLDLLGERVYLEWDLEDNGDWYRSEVLSGRIERGEAPRHLYTDGAATSVGVIYTRRNYFEASAETAIPLTNPNGTNVTSGLTLYNCNDMAGTAPNKRANYADIAAGAIDGTLPAPAHIEITNAYNSAVRPDRFYAAINRNSQASNVFSAHWLETGDIADSGASGGYYHQTILSSDYATTLESFNITAAEANRLRGNFFHVLIRFFTIQDAQAVKFWVGLNLGAQGVNGPVIRLGDARQIQDLGVVRMPPAWYNPDLSYDYMVMTIRGQRMTTGNKTVQVDYVMLAPVDGYRIYRPSVAGFGMAYTEVMVDNPDNPGPYIQASGLFSRPWIAMGEPLMLYPQLGQRIVLLHEAANGVNAAPDRKISLRAWYRPRRRSL